MRQLGRLAVAAYEIMSLSVRFVHNRKDRLMSEGVPDPRAIEAARAAVLEKPTCRERQRALYEACAGSNRHIKKCLRWLLKDCKVPITQVIREFKQNPSNAQPRRVALRAARHGSR